MTLNQQNPKERNDGEAAAVVQREVTEVTYSCLPDDHIDRDIWHVKVQSRGRGMFAVVTRSLCLSKAGTWDYEPLPSSRTDAWRKRYRFTFDEACRLAEEWAPKLTVNGLTALDVLARRS